MYIKLVDGVPERYTLRQLRKDNSNVSFPAEPTEELLASWDVYPFAKVEKPTCDPATEVCEQQGYVVVGGVYSDAYVVRNMTQEELNSYEVRLAERIRYKRNALLSESDWMGVTDRTMSSAEQIYRQGLRDITLQLGFPNNITWPTEPN